MKVNYSRIKDIAGDDTELIKTLLELYVDTYNKCLNDMDECILLPQEESDKKWHEANHELKGSSYNLGFEELGDLCAKNEKLTDNSEKIKVINEYKNILGSVMEIIAKVDV